MIDILKQLNPVYCALTSAFSTVLSHAFVTVHSLEEDIAVTQADKLTIAVAGKRLG